MSWRREQSIPYKSVGASSVKDVGFQGGGL